MDQNKRNILSKLKYLAAFALIAGLMCISPHAFAQSEQPRNPPPPPPPPDEVLRKINPFKKHHKDTADKKAADTSKNANVRASGPPGPPPPPNPLNLFRKKKNRDTTKKDN